METLIQFFLNHQLFFNSFLGWFFIWFFVLSYKNGHKDVNSLFRLHFWHGIFSSVLAFLSILYPSYFNEEITIACSFSYFILDIASGILGGASYQKGLGLVMEYFHHILSIIAISYSRLYYKDVCSLENDPILHIMLAEVSTPFLILFRRTSRDSNKKFFSLTMAVVFTLFFISVRIIYQSFYFLPSILMTNCNLISINIISYLYISLQFYFLFCIFKLAFSLLFKKKTV